MKPVLQSVTFGLCLFLSVSCARRYPLLSNQTGEAPKPATIVEPTSEIPARREFPVNTGLNPCDNFYQYACSVPLSRYKLPGDRNRHIFAINDSAERILTSKIAFMKGIDTEKNLSARSQQMKDYFAACLDTAARAEEEKARVKAALAEVDAIADRETLIRKLGENILTAQTAFVSFGSDEALDSTTRFDAFISPGLMNLPVRTYYEKPELLAAYRAVVETFFEGLDPEPKAAAKAVVDLEVAFAKTFPLPQEMRQRAGELEYYKLLPEMVKAYPNLALEGVFAMLPAGTRARDIFPESLAFVNDTLGKEELTNLKRLYLFHTLYGELREAYPDVFAKRREFAVKYLGSAPQLPPKEEECTQSVMGAFNKELDAELIGKLFPDFPKAKFESLAQRVREAIIRKLEKNTWLSEKGKAGALNKMRKARMQLASPNNDEEWDFTPVGTYNPKTPLANAEQRQVKSIEKSLAEFKVGRDWKRWGMGPLTVNAYYSPPENKFVMLQGILQYPFFDVDGSDAANFGAVGMVIGHELGHGIDNSGARYNADGIVEAWMPPEDLKEFNRRTGILVKQFDAYVPAEINAEYGKLTLGENIADTAGLSFGFEAAFPEGKGSLADKQAFYLQFARSWCGTMRDSELEARWRTDFHAQTEKRVNGPLIHQPGFYEAYACGEKDAMYLAPESRMDLW